MMQEALARVVEGMDLTLAQAEEAMAEMMEGRATAAQVAGLLVALRMKGESPEEIAGLARAMRARCRALHPKVEGRLVDLCGTGGAPFKTFNVSTISSFVVAGAGVPVAKHGNRSFTSTCGSADVMEALGVRIDLEPAEAQAILEGVGLCFLFAPRFHPAMKNVAPVRKELGIRTVFNILGPLTNPAGAKGQLMGVFHPGLVEKLPRVMNHLGLEHGMVVHGEVGSDEISTLGGTRVGELTDGDIRFYSIDPQALGIPKPRPEDLGNLDPKGSAAVARSILSGKEGPRTDIVLLNSAAALRVAGRVDGLEEGLEVARESIASGRAEAKLHALVKATGGQPP